LLLFVALLALYENLSNYSSILCSRYDILCKAAYTSLKQNKTITAYECKIYVR
jgi:hypothetical protein